MYRSNWSQTKIAITNEATITMTTVIPWACTFTLSLQKTTTAKTLDWRIYKRDINYILLVVAYILFTYKYPLIKRLEAKILEKSYKALLEEQK